MVEDVVAIWISVLQKYITGITTLHFFPIFYHSSPFQQIGREVVLLVCLHIGSCFISHLVHTISEV